MDGGRHAVQVSFWTYRKLLIQLITLFENPSIRTTETRFHEPARLSTPPKPLFSLKPLDDTRHNLVEVVVNSAERELKDSRRAVNIPKLHSDVPKLLPKVLRLPPN